MHASTYIPSGKPQLTGQSMILSEGVPCGPECFRHIQDFDKFMVSAIICIEVNNDPFNFDNRKLYSLLLARLIIQGP